MTGAPADRTQPPVQMQNVTTCSPLFCGASSARLRRQMAAAVRDYQPALGLSILQSRVTKVPFLLATRRWQ